MKKKIAATMAQVKPLKGKQAKEFKNAFEMSGVKKESFSKAVDAMINWNKEKKNENNKKDGA